LFLSTAVARAHTRTQHTQRALCVVEKKTVRLCAVLLYASARVRVCFFYQ